MYKKKYYNKDGTFSYVKKTDSFARIAAHPAFAAFSKHVCPWKGAIWVFTKHFSMQRVLRYVPAWNADTIVQAYNFLIDEINAKRKIYLPIYTQKECESEPDKYEAGLFYFQGDKGAPFAFVIAGGAFTDVAALQEEFPHARLLREKGYHVFGLIYRTGGSDEILSERRIARAQADFTRAMHIIFANAEQWNINTNSYSVWGSSAGGLMAANWSSGKRYSYIEAGMPAPSATILEYPVVPKEIAEQHPPVFVVVSKDDAIIPIADIDIYIEKLNKLKIETVYEKPEKGGHGFGIGVGTDAEGWFDRAVIFWEKQVENLEDK